MAIYFCRASHGKVGKAIPHYDYIHGLNKYSYKENEIAYVTENMPKWVNSNREFFEMSDKFERANGMSYKELKLALPNEFTLEENKKLLHDFLQKELGDKYYYSAVIHDKETEKNKVQQNIHVHLMFSTREFDGIERSGRNFFKQAYTKQLEKGGCPKNPKWDSTNRKSLKEIRTSWEQTLNAHLQEHGIEKVSSLSLKEQYQQALQAGDKIKARLLKRKPINIKMRIYKKALNGETLTRWEEKQYKKFLKNKAIKRSLEQDYNEIISLQKKLEKNKELIKETETKIRPAKEFTAPKYSSLLDVDKKVLTLEKELELLRNASSFSAVKISAINTINNDYSKLNNSLNYYLEKLNNIEENTEVDDILREEYTQKIASLRNQIESIEETINPDILKCLMNDKYNEIKIKLNEFENQKNELIKNRENNIYISPNIDAYTLDKISNYNKFSYSLETLTSLEWQLKNVERDIKQTEKKLNPKYISETAKDIFTKGKYRKNKADIEKYTDKINTIVREIQGGIYLNRPDLQKAKEKEYFELKEKLDNLKSKEFNFDKTSHIIIKIEDSLKNKLETRKDTLLNKKFILEQEIMFYKLGLLQDKNINDVFTNKEQIYSEKINNASYYEYKYRNARENIENIFSETNIEKLAYNKLTNGNYNKLIKEYGELENKINILKTERESISKFSIKSFSLKSELSKLEKQKLELQKKYHNMINAVDPNKLKETIEELKQTKQQAIKNIKIKEQQAKHEKFEYTFKQSRLREHKHEIKPYTFENYKNSTKELHDLQKNSFKNYRKANENQGHGSSKSLFDEEDKRKSLSRFYSERAKDHEDLGIDI